MENKIQIAKKLEDKFKDYKPLMEATAPLNDIKSKLFLSIFSQAFIEGRSGKLSLKESLDFALKQATDIVIENKNIIQEETKPVTVINLDSNRIIV